MYRMRIHRPLANAGWLLLATLALGGQSACAQATSAPLPPMAGAPVSDAPLFSAEAIAELVEPVALYPDDLLAIVLPASTYPLQIVQAQRFLDALASNPSLKPDETWDDSVVALLNYPEVIKLMNDDLDWTAELGQAVLAQQPEVIAAIEGFRRRAFTAGNLKSDDRQVVEVNDDVVYVRPADPKVIYVPYYDPALVTVYRPRPAYYYYPRPYPVYYYPYPVGYSFASGFFWGVTTYFTLGWSSHHLHVYDHDYYDHPYYGRPYLYHTKHYYYRRPPKVVNNYYYIDADRDRYDHDRHDRDRDRRDYDRGRYDREPWSDGNGRKHHRYSDRSQSAETYWRPDYRKAGARPGADLRRQPGDRQNRPPRPHGEALARNRSDARAESPQIDGRASVPPPESIPHAGVTDSANDGRRDQQRPKRGDLQQPQAERPARSRGEDRQYRAPDRASLNAGEQSRQEHRQWQRAEPTTPPATNPRNIQRGDSLQQRLAERSQPRDRAQPQAESPPRAIDRQTRQALERRGSSAERTRDPQIQRVPEQRTYRADVQRQAEEGRANREAVAGPRPSPRRESQDRVLAGESGSARAFGPRPAPRNDAAVQSQTRQQPQPRLDGNRFERREQTERVQPREPRGDRSGRNADQGRRAERGAQPGEVSRNESR